MRQERNVPFHGQHVAFVPGDMHFLTNRRLFLNKRKRTDYSANVSQHKLFLYIQVLIYNRPFLA